jgi:hypothetical protein
MKLDNILAGNAGRAREKQDEPVIDDLAGHPLDETGAHRPARGRDGAGQRTKRIRRRWSGDADDGDAGAAWRGRRREDGGVSMWRLSIPSCATA